tara:strand:- start:20027 stop:20914 length:888 start_codon:yes stop_codon:yes gene_type:complete
MTITRSTINPAYVDGVRSSASRGQESVPAVASKFFDRRESKGQSEYYSLATGLGYAQDKMEAQPVFEDQPIQDGQKTIVNKTVALQYVISQEALDDARLDEIKSRALNLGMSSQETFERDHMLFISNAFTGSTAQDEASIIGAHNLPGGGTYSNELAAAALSNTSLEALIVNASKTLRRAGMPVNNLPKMLLVPSALGPLAQRLLESNQVAGGNNNDINILKSRIPQGYVASPYLTSDTAYFLRNSTEGLISQIRDGFSVTNEDIPGNLSRRFVAKQRYGIGCADWRSICGSLGA